MFKFSAKFVAFLFIDGTMSVSLTPVSFLFLCNKHINLTACFIFLENNRCAMNQARSVVT